jgi:glycosyltransferase involved in cell wall biosynthesis
MARYLGDALASVFAQTYQPLDVIVVDDGSTDQTPTIVEPWAARLRYIRQNNAGESAARNTAIAASTADYIALLDADDLWTPDKLAAQIPVLDANPSVGLVCSDFAIEHADGRRQDSYYAVHPRNEADVFAAIFSGWSIPPSTVVFRRSLVDRVGLFDTSLTVGPDLHFFFRVAAISEVVGVERVLCTKKERPDGARGIERANEGSLRMLDRLEQAMPDLSRRRRALVRRRRAELELELGRYRVRSGRVEEGRRDLARAVRDNPLRVRALAWLALSLISRGGQSDQRQP